MVGVTVVTIGWGAVGCGWMTAPSTIGACRLPDCVRVIVERDTGTTGVTAPLDAEADPPARVAAPITVAPTTAPPTGSQDLEHNGEELEDGKLEEGEGLQEDLA
eukprot:CAMPEP_0184491320 /NCGR_PEP_ID=MMETSP0113_2-20130426/20137_1 /TAXON_ID=91329 /ORGANISM="Norrisiella sphaerica, Strain BC52" /LENGTH=103 /DNA_ID=CAMNT_0026875639 /DNA_START=1280 /DNA_END=1592 /DNA_ORIENTATION=-